jgi:hypothetical protein
MKNEPRVAGRQRSKAFARATLLTAALVGPAAPLVAQGILEADPADVESVDAIIAALYDVISGPAGQERDWDRFRSLFVREAHLVPTVVTPDGTIRYVVWSPEEYVTRAGPQLEEVGFFEAEIGRVTERFGNIAHIFSTYESSLEEDADPVQRGINSIQLFWDGYRWWIVNILWDQERDDNEIPERYLSEDS